MRRAYLRRRRIIGPSFPYIVPAPSGAPAGYQGLADIAGINWSLVYSVRGMSHASVVAGTQAVRLSDVSWNDYDVAPELAYNGGINTNYWTAATYPHFRALLCQGGSFKNDPYTRFGQPLTDATCPGYAQNGVKAGIPAGQFIAANGTFWQMSNYVGDIALPYTFVIVARHEGGGTGEHLLSEITESLTSSTVLTS
jgi:hypothetical protein